MKTIKTLGSIILLTLLSGCLGATSNKGSQAAPVLPERYAMTAPRQQPAKADEGSIYSEESKNLFEDSRARGIGDIVLINIVETSSGSKKAETKTSRDTTLTGGVTSFFGFESLLAFGSHTPSSTSMDTTLAKEFTGTGETTRDSSVTATISARVTDITMDGNLVIRGYREVRVNDETQLIIVSGLVRPEDVSQDNSILSSNIADARIEYTGTGTVSNKQQPGWLANTLDVVWPF